MNTIFLGDDTYPIDFDSHNPKKYSHLSKEEFRKLSKNLHRNEHSHNEANLFMNIVPLHGHIQPINFSYTKLVNKL